MLGQTKRELCRTAHWGDFVMYVFCGKRDSRWIEKKPWVLGGHVQSSFFSIFFFIIRYLLSLCSLAIISIYIKKIPVICAHAIFLSQVIAKAVIIHCLMSHQRQETSDQNNKRWKPFIKNSSNLSGLEQLHVR